jgi:hypothetical protein
LSADHFCPAGFLISPYDDYASDLNFAEDATPISRGQKAMKFHGSACLPLLLVGALQAAQVCDLTLTACPKALPAGTLTVPMDVISLDARVPVCQESGVITSQVQPSIVFIIDNSGSMSMGDYDDDQETDPTEARFSVVASLLEEINAAHPGTEVGLVAFSRRLQFDHRDNAFFKTAFPTDTSQHDSYAPLTALNKVSGKQRQPCATNGGAAQHAPRYRHHLGIRSREIGDGGLEITQGKPIFRLSLGWRARRR